MIIVSGFNVFPKEIELILTEKQIFEYCETKLAHYKLPRKIIFKDELPKNTVGKIDVNALQKEYAEKYEQ